MDDIIETAKEFGIDITWAIGRRKTYLNEQISELRKESDEIVQLLAGKGKLDRYLLLDTIKWFGGEIKRLEAELNWKGKSKGRNRSEITDDMIARARRYPIESLLQGVGNGKANCVSHQDTHPSMDTRNNFAYCYTCGFRGDVITVCMKVKSLDFISAVKFLGGVAA